jgi:hypothetical protein
MLSIISEREAKITQALYTMGMMRSAYWLSWITWEAIQGLVVTLCTIAFGAAIQLDFFLKNSFGNTFFTLFLFQLAMLGFAFTLAAVIRKTSTAIIIGFVVFTIGWIFQVRALCVSRPLNQDHHDCATPHRHLIAPAIRKTMPFSRSVSLYFCHCSR